MIKDLLQFVYSDEEVEKVFPPPPIVSYRRARKIKDYIVRSKLYLLKRSVVCRGCRDSRCQVMKNVGFIYLIESLTTDHFRSGWNNFKSEAKRAESASTENVKQQFLQSHFSQQNH